MKGPRTGPKTIPFNAPKETTELMWEPSIPTTFVISGSQLAKYVAVVANKTESTNTSLEGRNISIKHLFTSIP